MSSLALFSGSASAPSKSRLKVTTMRGFDRTFTLHSFYGSRVRNCNGEDATLRTEELHRQRIAGRLQRHLERALERADKGTTDLFDAGRASGETFDRGDTGAAQAAGNDCPERF